MRPSSRTGAGRSAGRSSDRDELTMLSPRDAQPVADFADRGIRIHGLDDGGQDVLGGPGAVLKPAERGAPGNSVTFGPDAPDALHLRSLGCRVDALDRRRADGAIVGEPVDPDDDLVASLDRLLGAVRRLLDLPLLEAALDGSQRPAHRLDLVEVVLRCSLELGRPALDEVRATERIGRLRYPALVRQDLLGPEGQP